jgi:hypothetical protein
MKKSIILFSCLFFVRLSAQDNPMPDPVDSIRIVTSDGSGIIKQKMVQVYINGNWRDLFRAIPFSGVIGLQDSLTAKLDRSEYAPTTPPPAVVDSTIWLKKWREGLYTPLTDVRLTDARTPLTHTHTKSAITDFTHTHAESDVTNLVTDLSAKQPTLTRATGAIVYSALANGTLALAFGTNSTVKVTPTATGSFTTTVPPAGCEAFLIIVTSGTASYTMTFGTGFRTIGTLATGTVTGKTFILEFISDGVGLNQVSRTAAQ